MKETTSAIPLWWLLECRKAFHFLEKGIPHSEQIHLGYFVICSSSLHYICCSDVLRVTLSMIVNHVLSFYYNNRNKNITREYTINKSSYYRRINFILQK